MTPNVELTFTDLFSILPKTLKDYGAFNISLKADSPLFMDPFLLFDNPQFPGWHDQVIKYLVFLRDEAIGLSVVPDRKLDDLFLFKEVKNNWLGYSQDSNEGHGLGEEFAKTLKASFASTCSNFGTNTIAASSHIEKLTLFEDGLDKDAISDFTVNLTLNKLCEYTQFFALTYLNPSQRRLFVVERAEFDYTTKTWLSREYTLPVHPLKQDQFVLLTPIDLLTKDETFINMTDMRSTFDIIVNAVVPGSNLRQQVNDHYKDMISKAVKAKGRDKHNRPKKLTAREVQNIKNEVLKVFPDLVDYYIKVKELNQRDAKILSNEKVKEYATFLYDISELSHVLWQHDFYEKTTGEERLNILKDVIENFDGSKFLTYGKQEYPNEETLRLGMQVGWNAVNSSVELIFGREVKFKLGRTSGLQDDVRKHLRKKPSMPIVIVCYNDHEFERAEELRTGLINDGVPNAGKLVKVIDAR